MDVAWITIGQILKPHGIHGYVRVLPLTDMPERFDTLEHAWIEMSDGGHRAVHIEQCRTHDHLILMKFESIDDPETAITLRGRYLQVPRTEAAPIEEDAYYVFDLIGYRVVTEAGEDVGVLRDVLNMPANDVFVVDAPQGEALIPAVRDVVTTIDQDAKRIVIRPIPGMLP